jgi:pimeloyl-ACP methyl ester carboxylesterase
MKTFALFAVCCCFACIVTARADERDDLGKDGFADSGGVKIHYVTKGTGPLVVLIHGMPDFWYTWRNQIPALAQHFQVVAVDLRGYNQSDQPQGVENYAIDKLVGDVDAVVQHFGQKMATIVGHDWGGYIGWRYAMAHPDKTERLIILNLPHPRCLARELANNPEQQKASAYARQFQKDGRGLLPDGSTVALSPELLAGALSQTSVAKDEADIKKYLEALGRSSIEGMMNYYKANYPRPPYKEEEAFPPVKCPVLMFHGLEDPFLLPGALNDTWRWLEKDLTLVTVPKAGHWVHHDAADLVTKRMVRWLTEE